jgi:hypothetical protein
MLERSRPQAERCFLPGPMLNHGVALLLGNQIYITFRPSKMGKIGSGHPTLESYFEPAGR